MRNSTKITESSLAAGLLWQQFTNLDHEEMWTIFLTRDNGVIASEMLTKGTLDSTPIDARLILRHALLNNAAGVIIVHNHPSGNARPSISDIRQTEKVKAACDLMDISLVDHQRFTGTDGVDRTMYEVVARTVDLIDDQEVLQYQM